MAAGFDDLQARIEEAERRVYAADARAAKSVQRLRTHWRSRIPTLIIGTASAVIGWQLLRTRRRTRIAYRSSPDRPWMAALDTLLRYGGPRLVTAISALVAGLVARRPHPPLASAPAVDLQRYSGVWYEIARLPERREKQCASDVTANYRVRPDGSLHVLNLCRQADGRIRRAIGHARVVDPQSNARLKVSYAPQLLDPIPLVWSDCYIIEVASDYSTAIIGTPDRAHLWLLARSPVVSDSVKSSFIAKALVQGFDTSRLIFTRHSPQRAPTSTEAKPTSSDSAAPVAPAMPAESPSINTAAR
jgi:apolipoprotein D and lipocalin family protein